MTPDPFDELEALDCNGENETLDDLEALLGESMASVKEEAEAKAARERIKRGGQSTAERQADAERMRRWELAHEWKIVANVGLFKRYACTCGSVTTVFEGLMTRQTHRHLRDSSRWQVVQAVRADLPNETMIQHHPRTTCPECAGKLGFDLSRAGEWK